MRPIVRAVPAASVDGRSYAIVVVGSGFGSGFFLAEALRHASAGPILVLEWGGLRDHATQLQEGKSSALNPSDTFVNRGERPWNFTIGYGGGTNCWFAQTPRMVPSDFELHSRFGVGRDWPISYAELEPYYCEAEEIMQISGDDAIGRVSPRSRPFPQPPHRMSAPDAMLKRARPDQHFTMPTARARQSTETRSQCCASLRCELCPADAKFTANNGLREVFGHPAVSLCTDAQVTKLDAEGGIVRRAVFTQGGRTYSASGDLFVLGANAIHSPAILLRSGMEHGPTGRGLHEAHGIEAEILLDGVANFGGSTITTGIDYGSYDGDFRRTAGSALILFENRWKFGFRSEPGRWRESLPVTISIEQLPSDENRVTVDGDGRVEVTCGAVDEYARRGEARALAELERIAAALPSEGVVTWGDRATESHVQGTLRMGRDTASSVVDAGQLHHRYRNLAVVGSSVFPTCTAANPSLTVAAMSMRAARKGLA